MALSEHSIEVCAFVVKDTLRQVVNNLQFVKNCSDGDGIQEKFQNSPKKGETINMTKPARFIGREGEEFQEEAYTERTIPVSAYTTLGVDVMLTNRELMFKMELDRISERIVKPSAETLANKIDKYFLALAVQATSSNVGTPGTVPTALKTYNQGRAKMSWLGAPQDGQSLLITPDMQVEAVDAGKSLFSPAGDIADQYKEGVIGYHSKAKVYEVQNLPTNTIGALGGTPLVNGALAQGATSIVTDGWTASAATRLKKGNRFTIAGVYAVNPWTRESIGALKQFTCAADAASDGSGNLTIVATEAVNFDTSSPYQNVDSQPADNAAITIVGAANAVSPQGLRFHPDAYVFDTANQPEPGGVEFVKFMRHPKLPIGIRYLRDWDSRKNVQISRMDVVPLFGIAYPEFACVVNS